MSSLSVVIPFASGTAQVAAALGRSARLAGAQQVILAGEGNPLAQGVDGVEVVAAPPGKGQALRAALPRVKGEVTVVQDADLAYSADAHAQLAAPIFADEADAVFAARERRGAPWTERALGQLARLVADAPARDALSGQRAFRTEVLRALSLTQDDDAVDAELLVKLAAQLYRVTEVPVSLPGAAQKAPLQAQWRKARTLLRYATVQNDADNAHEGYNTLARMEGGAPNYNTWLGQRFLAHAGRRVLEIGAGIGTITAQLEPHAELLVALEVDRFYVDRLKNRFRGKPHVRPYLSDVAIADAESLRKERIDTIVLSNVLEHIPDDGEAVRKFRSILQPSGRLLILVPALPQLFGALDEAVGHYRRYTPETLRAVLEQNGFTVETLEWMNLVGIPGWFVNGRLLRRRAMPPLQLRLYDQLAPYLARAESRMKLPVGMSLFAVARAPAAEAETAPATQPRKARASSRPRPTRERA